MGGRGSGWGGVWGALFRRGGSWGGRTPPQFQVATGELLARLVADHGFSPGLRIIEGHNHLSQIHSVGTADTGLGALLEVASAPA